MEHASLPVQRWERSLLSAFCTIRSARDAYLEHQDKTLSLLQQFGTLDREILHEINLIPLFDVERESFSRIHEKIKLMTSVFVELQDILEKHISHRVRLVRDEESALRTLFLEMTSDGEAPLIKSSIPQQQVPTSVVQQFSAIKSISWAFRREYAVKFLVLCLCDQALQRYQRLVKRGPLSPVVESSFPSNCEIQWEVQIAAWMANVYLDGPKFLQAFDAIAAFCGSH